MSFTEVDSQNHRWTSWDWAIDTIFSKSAPVYADPKGICLRWPIKISLSPFKNHTSKSSLQHKCYWLNPRRLRHQPGLENKPNKRPGTSQNNSFCSIKTASAYFLSTQFVSLCFLLNNPWFRQEFKMCKTLGFPVDITHRLSNAEENSLSPQVVWQLKLALIFDTCSFPNTSRDSAWCCTMNLLSNIYLSTLAFLF